MGEAPDTTCRLYIATGIYHPEPGGPATYLREIMPALAERGWDIRVTTFSDAPAQAGESLPVARIPRTALPLRMLRYATAARPLLQWADVVYLHTLGLPLWGNRRAPRLVKIVGDIAWERAVRRGWVAPTEDIDQFQTRRVGNLADWDKRRRAREARAMQAVIVPSDYLRQMVIGWGVPPERIHTIYNALPPSHTSNADASPSRAELRASLGLPDAPLLLTVGRILPWKGVDHLIAALARTAGDARSAHLVVAGDGDGLPRLQTLAEQTGIAERVHFFGRVPRDRVPLFMRAADYTVLYSGYEGLSHTLLESLREGTPVIASDKGGNPEVVQHGVNGLLVPYVQVEALAAALDEALRPGTRERLAMGAGAGMERFTFARMVEQTDGLLKTLV